MRWNRCGWFSAVLVAAVATLPAARLARAAPEAGAAAAIPAMTKVTVIDPPADDRVLVEAGLRIRSELDAAGLSNRAVTCAGGVGSVGCDATSSAAAIALSRQDGLATIRVIATLPDGYELHRLIRVSGPAGGDDPSVIAVRAVELLRDIYLDIPREFPNRDQAKRQPAPPVVAARPADAPSDQLQLRIFLGAAMLSGQRGLGPAVAPVIGIAVPIGRGLSLSGTAAGPFDRLVANDARTSTATTTQALVTFGARYELHFGRVSPFAALATGVHYIRLEGNPSPGVSWAAAESATTPLFAFGAGIAVWLRRWLAATAQLEAFYTQPMTNLIIIGEAVGRAGGPSLFAQLGLAVSLGER